MLKYFVSSRDPIFLRLCDDRNAQSGAGAGETYVLNGGDYVLENVVLNVLERDVWNDGTSGGG